MAREPIKGIKISLNMTDIPDNKVALKNLNLDYEDLDRIRGISDNAVTTFDVITLSSLNSDIEKELLGLLNETSQYDTILSNLFDSRRNIESNIRLNGILAAPSFKYKAINEYEDDIKIADVSTSRASAWSQFDANSLYYGGEVHVGGSTEVTSIKVKKEAIPRRFEGQIPTHKIRMNINGDTYEAFAMKGIPLKFEGRFGTVKDMRISVSKYGSEWITPTWLITNEDDGIEYKRESLFGTSGDSERVSEWDFYSDTVSKERSLEFYYPVNSIVKIDIPRASLRSFPTIEMKNLREVRLPDNDLLEMPDFTVTVDDVSPALTTIDLSRNDLTRSNDVDLRSFSPEVIQRLPSSLTSLTITSCYDGEATADLSALPSLQTFSASSLNSNSRKMFGASTPPIAASGMVNYNVNGNNFNSLDQTVQDCDTLETLNFTYNNISGTIVLAASNTLKNLYFSGNSCDFIDVNGFTNIVNYHRQYGRGSNEITNIFTNCPSLTSVRLNSSGARGQIPNFSTNTSLERFDAISTRLEPASSSYVIDADTFGADIEGGCRPTLRVFRVGSGYINKVNDEFHPEAFVGLVDLRTFTFTSWGRGLYGSLPDFPNSSSLSYLYLRNNRMSGSMKSYSTNTALRTLNVSLNALTGEIPAMNLPALRNLYLHQQALRGGGFTKFAGLNCPSLTRLYAYTNKIEEFPSLSGCPNLAYIYMNDQQGVNMSYTSGTLVAVRYLRSLNLSNCGLTKGLVDRIILDLEENYNLNNRSGVRINLLGNSAPSAEIQSVQNAINRLRANGWTIQVES